MESRGTCWKVVESRGGSWKVVESLGKFWNVMERRGIFKLVGQAGTLGELACTLFILSFSQNRDSCFGKVCAHEFVFSGFPFRN